MSAYADPELLSDFLAEAGEMLESVDVQLVDLEKRPDDGELLNHIFRGFHTIKGGAGFLEAHALVDVCHKTENLFDRLRKVELKLSPAMMDLILSATSEVKRMFDEMHQGRQTTPAPAALIQALVAAARGKVEAPAAPAAGAPASMTPAAQAVKAGASNAAGPDWQQLYDALLGRAPTLPAAVVAGAVAVAPAVAASVAPGAAAPAPAAAAPASPASPARGGAKPAAPAVKETSLRVDTARFDQILNLSGEIGMTRNRLNCLQASLAKGEGGAEVRKLLEKSLSELDTLVSDLQAAVMKARMQPVGRVFQKYVRLARDLARNLGKEVDLVLEGEDTEIDKTILEELNDPLVHLVRNALDHGTEDPARRAAAGKGPRAEVKLSARQSGDQILIEIADDGAGMRPEVIRQKAVEKGLITQAEAGTLDDRQSLNLVLLPGFSTKTEISDISGRGVGMDVVATNIRRLKGRIDIHSVPGRGTRFVITLPLTLAILPVLMLKCAGQPYALPLSAVHEIIAVDPSRVQHVAKRPAVLLRGEALPLVDLATLLDRPTAREASVAVLVQSGDERFLLAVDETLGKDEVMVKPLGDYKPRGISGATLSGAGELVLVLELADLLADSGL